MKNFKLITLTISICLSANAYSQTFCPPGATWYYTDMAIWWWDGYTKLTYVYDTVIHSITCKKITNYYEGTGMQGHGYGYREPYYTYSQNGIAYLYNNRYGNDKFDTLYNINAQIGDRWRFPLVDTACSDSSYFVEVLNTGMRVINGFNLQWLYIKIGPLSGNNYLYDTITDRFGCRYDNMDYYTVCYGMTDQGTYGGLRCYSDSTFGFYSTGIAGSCDYYYTGVVEWYPDENIRIYPTIVENYVNIKINTSEKLQGTFMMFDMSGRNILSEKIVSTTAITTFDVSTINYGIYLYKIDIGSKYFKTGKLIIVK